MSGDERGARAALMRAGLGVAALPYGGVVRLRNGLFDAGIRKAARLPRPVISIGNITTGGTGKTPVVRWLAERLRQSGKSVAVLSRGYKAKPGTLGDEQQMLVNLLNRPGVPPVIIRANPSRFAAGEDVLRANPGIDVFLLDDGFQHRQLARDFDIVLINAAEPFGFGRMLPRGMLREPLNGLRRANAFLLTRFDQASDAQRATIRDTLLRHNPDAPIYESVHTPTNADALANRRWFGFCGIGDPSSFVRQLGKTSGTTAAGHRAFADHHAYTDGDVRVLRAEAAAVGAEVLITTEKDWVKLAGLPAIAEPGIPIERVDVEIRFLADHASRLLADVEQALAASTRS